ncbi:MAG: metal ABC transporter permease [Tissierellia bacterium]|nr:metal ABC transporter permease [Tissierellia bacterium]
MLEFAFMRRALLAGFFLSIMIPTIGVVMVNRKTSMIGDALSHSALAGVGMGLILGFDPLIGMVAISIAGAFVIELIRHRFPQYGDMATAIVMSLGLGLASILSDFVPGGASFEAYLFGSIATVSAFDLLATGLVFLLVVFASIKEYSGLLAIAIDPNTARLSGVKVGRLNAIFTLLTAITIAMAVKLVGALMVTSLVVLPVASSLILAKSYRSSLLISIGLGLVYMFFGLGASFYYDLKPGGAIILIALVGMLVFWLFQGRTRRTGGLIKRIGKEKS